MRGLAYRRHQMARTRSKAEFVVSKHMGWRDPARVVRWADNLRKCSCPMCNSGDPHDRLMMKRAAAKSAFDLRDEGIA